jgi:hypothetical protein
MLVSFVCFVYIGVVGSCSVLFVYVGVVCVFHPYLSVRMFINALIFHWWLDC